MFFRTPGGNYVKKITVKNVGTEVQNVRYKLPESQFFYMEFPLAVKLSPGNQFTIEIAFRPIKLV